MTSINYLTQDDTLSAGDRFAVYSADNGNTRSVSSGTVAAFVQSQISNGFYTQYAAPAVNGFNVQVAPLVDGQSVWLLMTPAPGFASGVIALPPVYACVQGQEVLVNSTYAVVSLFIDGNGATAVSGAPTTIVANGFFRLRFDVPNKSWYRV